MLIHRTTSLFLLFSATLLLLSAIFLAGCTPAQNAASEDPDRPAAEVVLARIDGRPIGAAEFLREYERTAVLDSELHADTLAAFQDFLDRYVNFRLKVLEAREAGYHELTDLNEEINGYRAQLARPYVLKEEVTDPIIRLMYDRRQEMVDVSHILLRVNPKASPADTLAAYERLSAIRDSVLSGADFNVMARRHSEDPSARGVEGTVGSGGRLGFFGGERMVVEFEDQAYETPIESLSDIFRTQFGYHILKVHAKRALPGDIRIAHIMATLNPGADSTEAYEKIAAAKGRIDAGEPFEDVAREMSDDLPTAKLGGELQKLSFDAGLPVEMRTAAYALDVGEISEIVRSPFGYHIIRVLEKYPKETFEEAYDRLSPSVATLPRAQKLEKAFARKKRLENSGRADSVAIDHWMSEMGTDSLMRILSNPNGLVLEPITPIAWMADSTYSLGQFAGFVRSNRVAGSRDARQIFWQQMDDFLDGKALEFEIAALEQRDADFARTMTEFREGLILFRLMEDSVWTAASDDSTGLEQYYTPRATEYRYGDRARVFTMSQRTDTVLTKYVARIRSGTAVSEIAAEIAADTLNRIRFDTTMIESASKSVYDQALGMESGTILDPQLVNGAYVALYKDGVEAARQKTFDEARAQVVNEYQAVLEERLIKRLRAKYHVELYPDQLQYLVGSAKN